MSDTGTQVVTGLGRIVWGDPTVARDKMKDGQKVLNKEGQPVKQWSFGVAFPKAEFGVQIWPVLSAEAATLYTQGIPPGFAYKYKDGDSPEIPWFNGKQGKTPINQREGHAGHYVLSVSTEFEAPKIVRYENGVYMQLQPNQIKCGDYVMLDLTIRAHAGQTPGLYINPNLVLLCYEGPAIVGQYDADPTQSFGAAPVIPAAPPGAAMPGQGAPPAQMPQMPGQGAPPAMQPPAQQPQIPPPPPATMPPPAGPQRPTDPNHIHNNGNGTEQWLVNGAWDGGAHPVATMPPPATDFIPGAPSMPGPGNAPSMPPATGMPGQMPPR